MRRARALFTRVLSLREESGPGPNEQPCENEQEDDEAAEDKRKLYAVFSEVARLGEVTAAQTHPPVPAHLRATLPTSNYIPATGLRM